LLTISRIGYRLIKLILSSNRGPKTEDLLLKDIKVVKGFYINIVLEKKLKNIRI
jgi:hypothetical protein